MVSFLNKPFKPSFQGQRDVSDESKDGRGGQILCSGLGFWGGQNKQYYYFGFQKKVSYLDRISVKQPFCCFLVVHFCITPDLGFYLDTILCFYPFFKKKNSHSFLLLLLWRPFSCFLLKKMHTKASLKDKKIECHRKKKCVKIIFLSFYKQLTHLEKRTKINARI